MEEVDESDLAAMFADDDEEDDGVGKVGKKLSSATLEVAMR
jgi:hypothetical protein